MVQRRYNKSGSDHLEREISPMTVLCYHLGYHPYPGAFGGALHSQTFLGPNLLRGR